MCVLLVEDDCLSLLAAAMSLEAAGLEVMTAGHGQQAVEHADRYYGQFSCLVTDFHMPHGLTGAHVIEHVRPAYPGIPIILMSAITHVVTPGWRLQYGVDLLVKPFDMPVMVTLVKELLEHQCPANLSKTGLGVAAT